MRCIIVDDESLARERLRTLLKESGVDVTIVGEAKGGKEAVSLIHEKQPDVAFLDVQMPVLDGFDVVDLLVEPRPHIVFITAYDEYALQAFEVHALDYLMKPVRMKRLSKTLRRLQDECSGETARAAINGLRRDRQHRPIRRMTVHVGRRLRVIDLSAIRYIQADNKLVFVHLADGKYRTDFTLNALEQRLDVRFVRSHRSYLVNLDTVHEFVPSTGSYQLRLDDGTVLPVARRRVADVKRLLGG